MLWGALQIFGYKCLGEGDGQTGGFFGGNVGNVEVHQARISDGVYSYSCIVKGSVDRFLNHLYTIEKTERIRYILVIYKFRYFKTIKDI